MKKLAFLLAVSFTMASATATLAHDKDKGDACKSGKHCCKKTKIAIADKAKCKKACDKKAS